MWASRSRLRPRVLGAVPRRPRGAQRQPSETTHAMCGRKKPRTSGLERGKRARLGRGARIKRATASVALFPAQRKRAARKPPSPRNADDHVPELATPRRELQRRGLIRRTLEGIYSKCADPSSCGLDWRLDHQDNSTRCAALQSILPMQRLRLYHDIPHKAH
jgi:hypothetical protein